MQEPVELMVTYQKTQEVKICLIRKGKIFTFKVGSFSLEAKSLAPLGQVSFLLEVRSLSVRSQQIQIEFLAN